MNLNTVECPVCEQLTLQPETYSDDFEFQGTLVTVPGLERARCSNCGECTMFPAQVRANQVRIADAKRSVGGLLTSGEIKYVREVLGLSQADAAAAFGGGPNAFSKYERGEVIQSAQMDKLIRATVKYPDLLKNLMVGFDQPPHITVHRAPPSWEVVPHFYGLEVAGQQSVVMSLPADFPGLSWSEPLCANDECYLLEVGVA